MKREIKFRAWDKNEEEMCKVWSIDFRKGKNPHLIYTQFTGLTDKNGKEIYEGDILNLEVSASGVGSPSPGKYWIEYFADGFKLTTDIYGEKVWFPGASYPNGRTEVIGNIYENQGLLK